MLSPLTYYALLFLVCAYAFARGSRDERAVAAICITASLASAFVVSPVGSEYSGIEMGIVVVDSIALAGFTLVALRSQRFWPLWVAGIQLTTLLSHVFKAIELDLMPQAYAAAARLWVYPIFLIIVIGTWRSSRRRAVQQGSQLASE